MKLGSLRRRWLNEEEMSRYSHVEKAIANCKKRAKEVYGSVPQIYLFDNMYSDLLLAVDQKNDKKYEDKIVQAVYNIMRKLYTILDYADMVINDDDIPESTKDQVRSLCDQMLSLGEYKSILSGMESGVNMEADPTYDRIMSKLNTTFVLVEKKLNTSSNPASPDSNSVSTEDLSAKLNQLKENIAKWLEEKPGRRAQFGEDLYSYIEGYDEARNQGDLGSMREYVDALPSEFDRVKRDEAEFQKGLSSRIKSVTDELNPDKEVWKAAPAKRDEFYGQYESEMTLFNQGKLKFEHLIARLDFLNVNILAFQNSVKKSAANNPAPNGNPAGGAKPDPIDSPTNNDRADDIRRELNAYNVSYPYFHKEYSNNRYKSYDDYKAEIESAIEKGDFQRAEKLLDTLKKDYYRMQTLAALENFKSVRDNAVLTYNIYVQDVNNRKVVGSDFPEPFKSDLKRAAEELKKVLLDTKYLLGQPDKEKLDEASAKIKAANKKLADLSLASYGMKANPTGGTTSNNALVNKFSKIDSTLKYTDDYTMQKEITDYNKTRDSRDATAVTGRVKEYEELSKKSGLGKLWAYAKYAVNRGRDFVAGLLDKLNTWMKKIQQEIYEKGSTGFLTTIKKNIAKVVDFLTRKLHNLIQKHRGNISDYVYYKKNGKVYMAGNEKLSESYKVGFLNEDNFEKIDTGIGYLDSYDLGKRVDYVIENMILMGE